MEESKRGNGIIGSLVAATIALAGIIPTACLAFAAYYSLPTANLWMEKANARFHMIHFGGASVLMSAALALYLFGRSRAVKPRLQGICFRASAYCVGVALLLMVIMPVA
jgi:hypothetical protein